MTGRIWFHTTTEGDFVVTEDVVIAVVFVVDAVVAEVTVAEVVEEAKTTNSEDMKHFITDQKAQSNRRQLNITSR